MAEERLQKALARMGFASRREIERWIESGKVRVNGRTAELGDRVSEGDRVEFSGKRIIIRAPKATVRVLVYNKPVGEVCSRKDEEGRPSVFDHLPKITNARWVSIGRLDINTSGLLLFSSDGELANRLMHPSSEVEREYAVRVKGQVTPDKIRQLEQGVQLEDGPAHFDRIEDAGGQGVNHWYHVVLHEGRNREVRRLWEAVDVVVSRLIRLRYANVLLPRDLRQGKWVELELKEVKQLMSMVGLKMDKEAVDREKKKMQKTRRFKSRGHK